MSAEEDVLFPDKAVRLLRGQIVVVRPWGMTTGRLLAPMVADLLKELGGDYSTKAVLGLFQSAQDQVYTIIRETMGWDDAAMEALAYEDLLVLGKAVIEVCILRGEDAGGALGKLLALAGWNPYPTQSAETGSPEQSSS